VYLSTGKRPRQVPIHLKLKPVMRRQMKASKDGYVLLGLVPNKYNDRGSAIRKRFGRLKTSIGYDEAHVFHSIP
jgi:hypothetical protein